MSFWVYENYPANRAAVHEEGCRHCNGGHGQLKRHKGKLNGRWLGPFEYVEFAIEVSWATGRRCSVHSCCETRFQRTRPRFKRFELPAADDSSLGLLERFEFRVLKLYVLLRDEMGCRRPQILQSVRAHGGVEHAKRSLRRPVEMQEGFGRLKREGRLDQSI